MTDYMDRLEQMDCYTGVDPLKQTADELELARARLENARAAFRTNPSADNKKALLWLVSEVTDLQNKLSAMTRSDEIPY